MGRLPAPPPAPRGDEAETLHGERIADPYRWLERDGAETGAWTEAQNARTRTALDAVPEDGAVLDRIEAALRAHLRVVAEQLDVATVFVREWRYLEGERRAMFVAERRRYEERIRALFREGREHGELRTDLDVATAALLMLSAANWAYTWLRPGVDTDALADRFTAQLLDGMRGYASRA